MKNKPATLDRLHHLKDLVPAAKIINWVCEDAGVVDALRGSVYEQKWRGTLTEYFREHPIAPMVERAIERLSHTSEPSQWPGCDALDLGPIGLGTFGWKYDTSIIHRALDLDVRFIDAAETYGYGRVEKVLGAVNFHSNARIASKVARNRMSYQSVLNAAKRTMERLGRIQIDLYQIHWPNPDYRWIDTMGAMSMLHQHRAIRGVGLCNVSIDQIQSAQLALQPDCRVSTVQVRYNLMDRGIERVLLPYCEERDIQVIAYSPLAQGFGTILSADKHGALRETAAVYDATEAQIALAWIVAKGVIPIPRTNKVEHVEEIADVPDIELDPDDIDYLDEMFPIKE